MIPKRMLWKEFLKLHENLQAIHPRDWKIKWALLPKSIERDRTGDPVYFKTGRCDEPESVVMYFDHRLMARRSKDGSWEFIDRDVHGRVILYQNSYGCDVRSVWGEVGSQHPIEKVVDYTRWVLAASNEYDVIYWCPTTNQFMVNAKIMSRDYAWKYFNVNVACSAETIHLLETAEKMPSGWFARRSWMKKNPSKIVYR